VWELRGMDHEALAEQVHLSLVWGWSRGASLIDRAPHALLKTGAAQPKITYNGPFRGAHDEAAR
jgi:hypothetical protein